MTIHICDLCGSEMKVEEIHLLEIYCHEKSKLAPLEMCPACYLKVKAYLTEFDKPAESV